MDATPEVETVAVDADELDGVADNLLDIECNAEEIVEALTRLRAEATIAFGGRGYEWRAKLPPDLRDLIDEIEALAGETQSDANYAWRRLRKLQRDSG
ncbi:hypothetical protein [Mesorhizobium sp.]|uniref:hypothetical protein n=1 Tax=Mesorhizobium sp. TaxID=1871066 RepID=UPI000FE69363|nr:hypothetical protein [Mesorhizobium sp.]RWM08946.1 MAG: hypothetical protein EOR71_10555 [Mesorhizobium sp.]